MVKKKTINSWKFKKWSSNLRPNLVNEGILGHVAHVGHVVVGGQVGQVGHWRDAASKLVSPKSLLWGEGEYNSKRKVKFDY